MEEKQNFEAKFYSYISSEEHLPDYYHENNELISYVYLKKFKSIRESYTKLKNLINSKERLEIIDKLHECNNKRISTLQ